CAGPRSHANPSCSLPLQPLFTQRPQPPSASDYQTRSAVAAANPGRAAVLQLHVDLAGARKVGLERAALTQTALHVQGTAMLCDDAMHGRQPQPGPLPACLGRKEELKDALQRGLIDARP